ncbi:MAG: hypothetical protein QM813_26840 [Verrucomicrobiota bacterium]
MADLRAHSDLSQAATALEERFLATASALERLHEQGQKFVQDSNRLVCIAAGQAGGQEVYLQSRQIVETPLVFLTDCHTEAQQLLAGLYRDRERIRILMRARDDLQRTMAPLKFMQTLFKVESVPLGEQVQLMFTAVTHDIEVLHNQVTELFSTKFEELAQIEATIEKVIEKLQAQTKTLWNIVAKEKEQIDLSLEQLRRELTNNEKREARVGLLSADIAAEIQQIIIGLQFQDIINQKLQHSATAIGQIKDRIGAEDDEALRILQQACRLEAEQIKTALEELTNAENTVKKGISNVLTHLSRADVECLSLDEFDQLTTSADGIVQRLLEVIDGVKRQVAAAVASSADVYDTLRPIRSLASGLTDTVRDLSQRIHLIGLNAQVQAAQVGSGTGLEALSARTSEISVETKRVSETIATDLDQLVGNLTQSVLNFERLHTLGEEQLQVLNQRGAAQEDGLHALRNDALATLNEISDLLTRIREDSQQALDQVNYLATVGVTLAAIQARLEGVATAVSPCLRDDVPPSADLRKHFERNYTMASEQQVFERIIGGNNAASTPVVTSSESSVELFSSEPEPTAAAATVRTDVAAQTPRNDLPELWASPTDESAEIATTTPTVDSQPASPKSQPVGTKTEDFGANVELF